ncbi:MAG TPA: energy transducer TonB [Longimicrobium sp.]|jgi:TonB family protein|nr:energy transducer TonB [Longimicrobium sp.]
MFNVVVDRRKRRVWSARTVAASVGAHLLVLAGVVAAASSSQAAPAPFVVDIWTAPPSAPAPVKPTPPPPSDQPVPVKGRTLALQTPTTVPPDLPPPNPDAPPANPEDYTGNGPVGNVIGTPPATPQPPAADPGPLPDFRIDEPIDARNADQLPQLLSPRDAQRMLERVYPSMLRDAGVTGHTTVLLVIDKTGAVEPGSITVQETTHDQFRDAAIRAAQRFRFRPAKLHGEAVAVSISIPIEWQIQP